MMHKRFFTDEIYDSPLYESEHFNVVPSLGSLVEGWVLVVPKEEILNFSQLTEKKYSELEELVNFIKSFQTSLYENAIVFEHGPTDKCSKTGCGVDYAHLHMVPYKYDLIEGIQKYFKLDLQWIKIKDISEISEHNTKRSDYLYFRTQDDKHFITLRESFPSQIFRQVISNYEGIPERFDWKTFPEYNTIIKTIGSFDKLMVYHEHELR